jgi:hypothetical protein
MPDFIRTSASVQNEMIVETKLAKFDSNFLSLSHESYRVLPNFLLQLPFGEGRHYLIVPFATSDCSISQRPCDRPPEFFSVRKTPL